MRFILSFLCSAFLLFSTSFLFAQENEIRELQKSELGRYDLLSKRAKMVLASAESYDVSHYRIDIVLPSTPTKAYSAMTEMNATSLVPAMTLVEMNAGNNLTIDSVLVNGKKATFTHTGDVLSIPLMQPILQNETFHVDTYFSSMYNVNANAISFTDVQNVDQGKPTISIASQSEPYDARRWWPCKDDPNDKADSLDVVMTTATELVPVSNGLEISNVDNGNGTHTVHWKSNYPIVTYLVSIAVAGYNHNNLTFDYNGNSMYVGSWFYSMPATQMQQHENTMVDALGVLSDLYIPYPFMREKYGMAEYEWGGAMEHQTVTSMGFYGMDVVVHELSHQWFGDKVTCATFEHIWLNEGWATYSEALYREAKGGLPALKAKTATTAYYGPGTIFVADPENNQNQIFSGALSYNKASWVLHMVRHVVGDSAFFRAIRTYLGSTDKSTYRSVKTQEFQQYLEAESGMDLTAFFQNWIYGEYYPTYRFEWKSTAVGNGFDVDVTIEQMSSPATQIFDIPIDLNFDFGTSDTTIVVENRSTRATYSFHFEQKPIQTYIDKDNWILKRVVQPVTNPTFDNGILVVNGIDWDEASYTADLKAAFMDSVFTGSKPYALWDVFANPAVGYPTNVPEPIGSGAIPPNVLGKYCTIVWLGNAYNGDDAVWQNTSIWEYVKAGGNLILITRMGRSFINTEMQLLLGMNWAEGPQVTVNECHSEQMNFQNMTFTGAQNLVAPFSPSLFRSENIVLFTDPNSFQQPVGIGVWGKPMQQSEKESGHMVYLAMRPYRIERTAFKQNMSTLLDAIPCVPIPTDVAPIGMGTTLSLGQNYPNPLLRSLGNGTSIRFTIPQDAQGRATLRLYNVLGRLVKELFNEDVETGNHEVRFDTSFLQPGAYVYQLTFGDQSISKMMLVAE